MYLQSLSVQMVVSVNPLQLALADPFTTSLTYPPHRRPPSTPSRRPPTYRGTPTDDVRALFVGGEGSLAQTLWERFKDIQEGRVEWEGWGVPCVRSAPELRVESERSRVSCFILSVVPY